MVSSNALLKSKHSDQILILQTTFKVKKIFDLSNSLVYSVLFILFCHVKSEMKFLCFRNERLQRNSVKCDWNVTSFTFHIEIEFLFLKKMHFLHQTCIHLIENQFFAFISDVKIKIENVSDVLKKENFTHFVRHSEYYNIAMKIYLQDKCQNCNISLVQHFSR